MIYIYAVIALSIWFSLTGIIAVLKPRLKYYVTTIPILLAMLIGVFAGTIDEYLGYIHTYVPGFASINGLSFYEFIFMENWAYSVFVICTAFAFYEFAKLAARKYLAKNLIRRHVPTGEFMRDLPDISVPSKSSDYDLF